MHSCDHNREDLVLHYYGELDEADREEVAARLAVCSSCSHYYSGLTEMESVLPRSPSVEPDETVMAAIRSATSKRVQHLAERRSRQRSRQRSSWSDILVIPTLPRLVMAAAVLVVGFFVGRLTSSSGSFFETVADGGLSGVVEISEIAYNPESGLVSVQYRTAGASSLEGSIESASIRALLGHALTDVENPAGRLRAAKLLSEIEPTRIVVDPDLIDALGAVLTDESNDGMKIQAVRALRRISGSNPVEQALKAVLLEMLETAENSALRMEVLELLTESEMMRQELARILTRATTDENSFIRYRARTVLGNMGVSQRLDQMNEQGITHR